MSDRELPRNLSNSFSVIYRITHLSGMGSSPGTYMIEEIRRKVFHLRNRTGRYVRYDNRWYPLHEEKELHTFLKKVTGVGAIISKGYDYFSIRRDKRLPFILTDESPLGHYAQALYR